MTMSSVPSGTRVRVVTDSTAGLPARLREPLGIAVVPLAVSLGTRDGLEGIDVGPSDVAAALASGVAVVTSQPAPGAFLTSWAGAPSVVSVHLSAALSGTFQSATLAARSARLPVEVVDSGTTGMGLGFIALAAGRVAAAGGSFAEVAAAAREAVQQTDSFFLLDSVEALHRGGRLAGASALVGAALAVKPILQVSGGGLVPLERVRTFARGLARLAELAVSRAEGGRVEIAVQHLRAEARASSLARVLDETLGDSLVELEVLEVSSVVGAHVGLGCVGVTIHRL